MFESLKGFLMDDVSKIPLLDDFMEKVYSKIAGQVILCVWWLPGSIVWIVLDGVIMNVITFQIRYALVISNAPGYWSNIISLKQFGPHLLALLFIPSETIYTIYWKTILMYFLLYVYHKEQVHKQVQMFDKLYRVLIVY